MIQKYPQAAWYWREVSFLGGREEGGHLHNHRAMDIEVRLGRSLFRNVIIAWEGGILGVSASLVA